MNMNSETLVSITDANKNFSRIARLVDEKGSAVILKNNRPRYVVLDIAQLESASIASDEDVLAVSKRLMQKNQIAYEELAK